MSWLFSQALVEAFSEANSLDGAPCAQLSVMPTPHKFWRNDKTMEFSKLSQFGLTCAVLTEDHGAALLTSFLEASHARTSAQQAEASASMERVRVSGLSSHGSLARFDPDSSLWKTPQCSLLEGLGEFLETWPRWGSMRNGVSWARMMPAHLTSENASGFWPTPGAAKANNDVGLRCSGDRRDKPNKLGWAVAKSMWPTPTVNGNHNRKGLSPQSGDGLATAVARFPTPRAADGNHLGATPTPTTRRRKEAGQANLSEFVLETTRPFPTPCARDYRSSNSKPYSERGGGRKGEQLVNYVAHFPTPTATNTKANHMRGADKGKERESMNYGVPGGGQLNPDWVEWLMGWPIGWTDLKPLAMDRFQRWRRLHGIYWRES